jgi:hypothetical protein
MSSTSFSIAEIFAADDETAAWERPRDETDELAEGNFSTNISALRKSQADLADRIEAVGVAMQFVRGRDDFLTARDEGGWWTGCSIPLAVGRELLKTLELAGVVGCYIQPTHAGQLRACFERIAPGQAIIVVVPDLLTAAVMLRCDDFSAEVAAGRLFFAAGWDWASRLEQIFRDYPGLPLPQQFIRTALLEDEQLQRFAAEVQAVVATQTQRRSGRIAVLRWRSGRRATARWGWVVVAGSQFRLGDLTGPGLSAALAGEGVSVLNPDDPRQASPLAVAEAAAGAEAIIVADVFRADMPDVLARQTAWITWVSGDRVAPPDAQAPRDGIILADAGMMATATAAGWDASRIEVGAWPDLVVPGRAEGRKNGRMKLLGLIADTFPLEVPARIKQFSSHALLWEMIAEELTANPLAVGTDPHEYLRGQMARLEVRDEGMDRRAFLERLILPAYQKGLAGLARRAGLPLALLGRGWSEIPELAPHAVGPIGSMEALAMALGDCGALIHPSPLPTAHPVQAMGLCVVQPAGSTAERFVQSARQALRSGSNARGAKSPILCRALVQKLIDRTC